MSLEDDLRALERKQMPFPSLLTDLWAEDTLRVLRRSAGIVSEWERQWQDELRWLRASLEADVLPDWCIEMVIANWRKEQVNQRWPLIRE